MIQITFTSASELVGRRISRQTPSTQRDIIAEALSEGLKTHGYLS